MSEPSNWPLSGEAERILIPKVMLKELENNALTQGCYPTAIGFYPSAYRHQMKRRGHDDYLIMYCVAGQGSLSVGADKTMVQTGDLMILPPGMDHHYEASEEKPWTVFWCHFKGSHSERFYEHIGFQQGLPVLHGFIDVQLQASFQSLMEVAHSGYSTEDFIHASNLLRTMLTSIAQLRKKFEKRETTKSLQRVRQYMRSNLNRRISLDELAGVANLSKYHFTRKYRELTGYAPLQHFEHLKIEQACLLLESTGLTISEIAFQLGYDDPLYFSRVFRKSVSYSPTAYRMRWRH